MAKAKTLYTCTEGGGQTLKWQGQCPHCSAWNTLVETVAERASARYQGLAQASQVQELTQVEAAEEPRRETGIAELDRVLGVVWCAARWSCWEATPASASRPCCCRR